MATSKELRDSLAKALEPHEYYRRCIVNGKRHGDGRVLGEFRKVHLSTGVISTSAGSASVELGDTYVICAVNAVLAEPVAGGRDRGAVLINMTSVVGDLVANSQKEATVDEAKCGLRDVMPFIINSESLCVAKECLCWVLHVDVTVMSNGGGLLDASLLAVISALKQVHLPTVVAKDEDDEISLKNLRIKDDEPVHPLKLTTLYPVACTFMLYDDDHLLCDPSLEETVLFNSAFTVVVAAGDVICGLYKFGGAHPLRRSTMAECFVMASRRRREMLTVLGVEEAA